MAIEIACTRVRMTRIFLEENLEAKRSKYQKVIVSDEGIPVDVVFEQGLNIFKLQAY